MRGHSNKLLKDYGRKKNFGRKSFRNFLKALKLDVILEEILEEQLKNESQNQVSQDSADKSKQNNKEKKAADVIRRSIERCSETQKREAEEGEEHITPKSSRSNGSDTVNFLREKAANEYELRKEKSSLKRE